MFQISESFKFLKPRLESPGKVVQGGNGVNNIFVWTQSLSKVVHYLSNLLNERVIPARDSSAICHGHRNAERVTMKMGFQLFWIGVDVVQSNKCLSLLDWSI